MSYQQKLEEVKLLLDQHNSSTSDNFKIDVAKFFTNLNMAGGSNEAALSQCTWEDLQEFGLPKLLAKQVAIIFRAKEDKPILKKSKIEAMSIDDLVMHYDPRTPFNLISERLNTLLGKKRFIVFNEDGTVNTSLSAKLANEIVEGYPERDIVLLDEIPVKVYAIGDRPDQSFDENPLYPGRILRPDGDCDQTNRSWKDVGLETKQILYLAVTKTNEYKVYGINEAHDAMDLVVGKTEVEALSVVRKRFPKAAALLKELYKQGNPPRLKIFKKNVVNQNNPFGTNKVY